MAGIEKTEAFKCLECNETHEDIDDAITCCSLEITVKGKIIITFEARVQPQSLSDYKSIGVAAPTAGLHFTQRVLDDLKSQSISSIFVTLHVGAGTFKPVKSDTMQEHEMHQEQIDVSLHALQQMRNAVKTNRIVAVGTTSLRTIESIYWFGVKLQENQGLESFTLGQWDPYELSEQSVSAEDALDNVLAWMHRKELGRLRGNTQLIIALGYTIRLADALITNFHQPKSTLLLLVASFIGDDWRKVYEYALKNDFRFLSFGDSSILFRNP